MGGRWPWGTLLEPVVRGHLSLLFTHCRKKAQRLELIVYVSAAAKQSQWPCNCVKQATRLNQERFMTDDFTKAAEQVGAFQKIWTESFTQLMQTAFTTTPTSAPPEVLREMRSGILKSLARSWDEFLRSPQFLDVMRQ